MVLKAHITEETCIRWMQKKKKNTGFKKISSKEKNYKRHYAHVTDKQPRLEEAIASGFATGT